MLSSSDAALGLTEREDLLSRDVPWETFMHAKLITEPDLQVIRRFDKRPRHQQQHVLTHEGHACMTAFLRVLRNVTRADAVQYVLALLLQLVEDRSGADLCHGVTDPNPYALLLRLAQRDDARIQDLALHLYAELVHSRGVGSRQHGPNDRPGDATLTSAAHAIAGMLRARRSSDDRAPLVLASLALLVQEPVVREAFVRSGGVELLSAAVQATLEAGSGVAASAVQGPAIAQMQYHAMICLWKLSYHEPAVGAMEACGLLGKIVGVLRLAVKEKVVRAAALCLRSILEHRSTEAVGEQLAEANLSKVVGLRIQQAWHDEDLMEALKVLQEKSAQLSIQASSLERFRREVVSGALAWSPMHTEERFWRENVDKMGEKDFQVIKMLVQLLQTSRDVQVLAVGCSDIHHFLRHHPQGRQVLHELGGKSVLMRLIVHPDPEVQRHALQALQQVLLSEDKLTMLAAMEASA
ncbi:unnamed protein product [Pedinophyceae sp. YPF-701]|nr:unnamed protein product [Pedinophyceae sp. YPF-701]